MSDGIRLFSDELRKDDYVYCLKDKKRYIGKVVRVFKNGKADIDWGQWSKRMKRDQLCLILTGDNKAAFDSQFDMGKKLGMNLRLPSYYVVPKPEVLDE